MNVATGDRVCSCVAGLYKGVPGTVIGTSQMQGLDRPGWDLDVDLDNGRRVRINEYDVEPVTPEIEEAYNRRVQRDNEINRRAEERAKRQAEDRKRNAEERAERKRQAEVEIRNAQQAEHDAEQKKIREDKGREYGLRSLGINNE